MDGVCVTAAVSWAWLERGRTVNNVPRAIARQEPGPSRELYRLAGDRYVYAAHTHVVCDGCGVLHARWTVCRPEGGEAVTLPVSDCALCGAALASVGVRS